MTPSTVSWGSGCRTPVSRPEIYRLAASGARCQAAGASSRFGREDRRPRRRRGLRRSRRAPAPDRRWRLRARAVRSLESRIRRHHSREPPRRWPRTRWCFPLDMAGADPVASLNIAFAADGVVIAVAPDVVVERADPSRLRDHGRCTAAMFTRSRLELGSGAALTLVETHEGRIAPTTRSMRPSMWTSATRPAWTTSRSPAKARLRCTSQRSKLRSARCGVPRVRFHDRRRRGAQPAIPAARGRGDHGQRAQSSLLAGRQHADTTLIVDHVAAGSQSREVFKAWSTRRREPCSRAGSRCNRVRNRPTPG